MAPTTGAAGDNPRRVETARGCAVRGAVNGTWVMLIAGGLCAPLSAQSSEGAATDDPDEVRPRYFTLEQFDAYLDLESEFTNNRVQTTDRRRRRGESSQVNREYGFEERLGFTLRGSILDPGIISYSADLAFGLRQDHFRESDLGIERQDRDAGYLLDYDVRVDLFSGKPISGSLYGLRNEHRINRRFQPTLNERRTGFGTSWRFVHDRLPMELTYDYLETDRTGNFDRRDNEHYTESTLHYSADWLISDYHHLRFDFEHAENKQEFQGLRQAFDTTRDLFTIEHELEFGAEHQHSLRTLAHWQEESGDFARDFFEIGPQLSLKHNDHLQTLYKYQFNRERFAGLDVETQRFDMQLIHQLYSNLTTTVDVFGLVEDVERDINTTQYGASVDWQYNRKNRWGHFYANLALAYDTEDVNGDNGRRIVLNESAAFRDPLAVTLRNRNVERGSVVVTDTTNRRVFLPGRDYIVFRQRTATRLARVRTGRIADGDTVLIDYAYRTPAGGKLDTVRVDFSIEQAFDNGLTPYYRLSYRNQEDDVSTGFARRVDRTDHHRVGVTYEAKRYNLSAELEIFDDTVDPYHAFHINGTYHILQQADHTLEATSRLSRLFFEGGFDRRNVTLFDVELDHHWQLSEALSTTGRIGLRLEDDSLDGITRAWDATAGIAYRVGDLSCEFTLEYDRLDLPRSDQDVFGVYFRVRREFPNVLARL